MNVKAANDVDPKLTLTFGDVLLGNIIFFIFAVFDVSITKSPLKFV